MQSTLLVPYLHIETYIFIIIIIIIIIIITMSNTSRGEKNYDYKI